MQKKKIRIGLAFGGGGVRAGAHIGVLEVLEKNNIHIDMVAGTSAGSAMAALYAWGCSAEYIKNLFLDRELSDLISAKPSLTGFIIPQGYLDILQKETENSNIEDAKIPLYIIATDLVSRKEIVFDRGNIARAVHASSALPGLIQPVKIGNMLLTDGGIVNNCPGNILRDRGADIILAVNCSCVAPYRPKNHIDVLFRAMDIIGDCNPSFIDGDWVISPINQPMGVLEKRAIEKSYYMGRECAEAHIGELKELLKSYNGNPS